MPYSQELNYVVNSRSNPSKLIYSLLLTNKTPIYYIKPKKFFKSPLPRALLLLYESISSYKSPPVILTKPPPPLHI